MREAWKGETYVRSQSFSSELAVKYLHVGRRKIQISPPPGEQDQSNALPQGQQRQFTKQIFFPRANNPSASLVNNKLVETTWRRLGKSKSTDGIRYLD